MFLFYFLLNADVLHWYIDLNTVKSKIDGIICLL